MSTTTAWDTSTAPQSEESTTVKLPIQGKIRSYSGGAPTLTIRGRAGTAPDLTFLPSGSRVCRFRMAVTQRGRDEAGIWHDVATTWYTVKAWNNLAENIAHSILKGQPVLVAGRLDINQWENKETGQRGTEVAIIATSVGHDLAYGTARYHKLANDGYDQPRTHASSPEQPAPDDGTTGTANDHAGPPTPSNAKGQPRESTEVLKTPPF